MDGFLLQIPGVGVTYHKVCHPYLLKESLFQVNVLLFLWPSSEAIVFILLLYLRFTECYHFQEMFTFLSIRFVRTDPALIIIKGRLILFQSNKNEELH